MDRIVDETRLKYKKCSESDDHSIYHAFQTGFSDYIVKMEVSQEDFFKRFFGPEGNSRVHSFIAFYEENPIGVILGGIKTYEGIKTMRCGALAIHPSYRGKGVSQRLYELHKEEAMAEGCKQLFLEVIAGNDRAINFYKRLGYEKVYDLTYYSLEDLSTLKEAAKKNAAFPVKSSNFSHFQENARKWNYHINWQNDLEYIEKLSDALFYSAIDGDRAIGYLVMNPNGTIRFLMVDQAYRNQGIGTSLLLAAVSGLNSSRLSVGFPNNSLLGGFFKKLRFEKSSLAQYEMYKTL